RLLLHPPVSYHPYSVRLLLPPPALPTISCTPPSPPQMYPLSLHDALPISSIWRKERESCQGGQWRGLGADRVGPESPGAQADIRSEEHTSELQSLTNLVCRLLLEKKKKTHSARRVR